MKKVLFFAVALLSSAMLFIGCEGEKKQNTSGVTALTITPAELSLTLNDNPVRLAYETTPKGAKAVIVWETSNQEIVTVDANGTVTPINNGEAIITATVKDTEIKATCKVKVISFEESLTFAEAYIGIMDYDSVNTVEFEHSQLGLINAHIAEGVVRIFTSGMYYNASGKLDGAQVGGMITLQAPIALAYPEENKENPNMAQFPNGVSFSLGEYGVVAEPKSWHEALAGYAINDTVMSYVKAAIAGLNAAGGQLDQATFENFAYAGLLGFGGACLNLMQYVTDEENQSSYEGYPWWMWDYYPNAIITDGIVSIGGEEGSSQYMNMIEYMDLTAQFVLSDDSISFPAVFTAFENGQYVLKSTAAELGNPVKFITGEVPAGVSRKSGVEIFVPYIIPMVSEDIKKDIEKTATYNSNFKLTVK